MDTANRGGVLSQDKELLPRASYSISRPGKSASPWTTSRTNVQARDGLKGRIELTVQGCNSVTHTHTHNAFPPGR